MDVTVLFEAVHMDVTALFEGVHIDVTVLFEGVHMDVTRGWGYTCGVVDRRVVLHYPHNLLPGLGLMGIQPCVGWPK